VEKSIKSRSLRVRPPLPDPEISKLLSDDLIPASFLFIANPFTHKDFPLPMKKI
jgi:hypothetical protein